MGKEAGLQYTFEGVLVDPRSARQKRRDEERCQTIRQMEMFSQKDLAQFGVRSNPRMPLSSKTRLELAAEDPRTDEEKEYDRMKTAEALTYPLSDTFVRPPRLEPVRTRRFASGLRFALVDSDVGDLGVALTEDLVLAYWTTRDEEYERARDNYHRLGYRTFPVGDDQLEVWHVDGSGYWLVTYSDMEMLEDIEWVSEPGPG